MKGPVGVFHLLARAGGPDAAQRLAGRSRQGQACASPEQIAPAPQWSLARPRQAATAARLAIQYRHSALSPSVCSPVAVPIVSILPPSLPPPPHPTALFPFSAFVQLLLCIHYCPLGPSLSRLNPRSLRARQNRRSLEPRARKSPWVVTQHCRPHPVLDCSCIQLCSLLLLFFSRQLCLPASRLPLPPRSSLPGPPLNAFGPSSIGQAPRLQHFVNTPTSPARRPFLNVAHYTLPKILRSLIR